MCSRKSGAAGEGNLTPMVLHLLRAPGEDESQARFAGVEEHENGPVAVLGGLRVVVAVGVSHQEPRALIVERIEGDRRPDV